MRQSEHLCVSEATMFVVFLRICLQLLASKKTFSIQVAFYEEASYFNMFLTHVVSHVRQ